MRRCQPGGCKVDPLNESGRWWWFPSTGMRTIDPVFIKPRGISNCLSFWRTPGWPRGDPLLFCAGVTNPTFR